MSAKTTKRAHAFQVSRSAEETERHLAISCPRTHFVRHVTDGDVDISIGIGIGGSVAAAGARPCVSSDSHPWWHS